MAAPTATVIRCSRKEHGTKLNGKDTVNMQYAENDKKGGISRVGIVPDFSPNDILDS